LPVFTLPEMRNMILLTNTVLENASLENEELLQLNRIITQNEQANRKEQVRFVLNEEEENDDSAYRHSYYEEQLLMQAIREGRAADAVRLAESMDRDSGRLAGDDVSHHRNLAIIGITLCSRAAIDGGVSPESAYRLSGYYIQKCDEAQDPAHMLHYRNRAIEELAGRVAEKLSRPHTSNHVERCKDYVRKHYREKIYLEDIADSLGISPGYLSKLFRKETGVCLQDYINEERVYRAANLLVYSDLSLPEIAEYVHFPNQSYFGKIFKKLKGMTPKEYRDQNKAKEVFVNA
jgi:Response regulator containing CheY-like receiver domain and AraC-type DNA-binding domain